MTTPATDIAWMAPAISQPVIVRHFASDADPRIAACGPIRIDQAGTYADGWPTMPCPGCLLVAQGWRRGDTIERDEPRAGVHHLTAGFLASLPEFEREDAERLAAARQQLAATGTGRPAWHELTDDERATSTMAAVHYIRAARQADLLRDECRHCGGTR